MCFPLTQIDPDERPRFHEAVKILEQMTVPEEGEGLREGGREDEDLRPCFSEPLLRCGESVFMFCMVCVRA